MSADDRRRYFETLYGPCDGWIELRSLPSKRQCWAEVGDWDRLDTFIEQQLAAGETIL